MNSQKKKKKKLVPLSPVSGGWRARRRSGGWGNSQLLTSSSVRWFPITYAGSLFSFVPRTFCSIVGPDEAPRINVAVAEDHRQVRPSMPPPLRTGETDGTSISMSGCSDAERALPTDPCLTDLEPTLFLVHKINEVSAQKAPCLVGDSSQVNHFLKAPCLVVLGSSVRAESAYKSFAKEFSWPPLHRCILLSFLLQWKDNFP